MTTTMPRLFAAAAACALALGLAACGSASTPNSSTPSAATAPTSSSGATGTAPGGASAAKVSANTASEDEIAAALESAGVSNPEKWAEEVVEYRPYPADDPNLTTLREELAKYNPGQETTDKIVAALQP